MHSIPLPLRVFTHFQGANGAPWSLIAHATASNLKSTAPCLIQDLCNNYPSVLFDTCGRRACRRVSIGYCLLSSAFFRALLTSQTSLLSLKDLVLLDCITDAPPELLHKVYVGSAVVLLTVLPASSSLSSSPSSSPPPPPPS